MRMLMRWELFIALVSIGLLVPLATYAEPTSYNLKVLKAAEAHASGNGPLGIPESFLLTDQGEIVALKRPIADGNGVHISTPHKSFVIPTGLGFYVPTFPAFAWNDRGEVFLSLNNAIVSPDQSGGLTTIVKAGQIIDGKRLVRIDGPVDTNAKGQITFKATFEKEDQSNRSRPISGLFTLDRLVAQVRAKIDDMEIEYISESHLTDAGEVLFSANVSGIQGSVIFKDNRVLVKAGDTIGGNTIKQVAHNFVSSRQGHILFNASSDTTPSGLFTLDGLVVKTGDLINGRPLTMWQNPVINNHGEVAFLGMDTGTSLVYSSAVVLATPTTTSGAAQASTAMTKAPGKSSKLIPVLILVGIVCALWFFWPKSQKRS